MATITTRRALVALTTGLAGLAALTGCTSGPAAPTPPTLLPDAAATVYSPPAGCEAIEATAVPDAGPGIVVPGAGLHDAGELLHLAGWTLDAPAPLYALDGGTATRIGTLPAATPGATMPAPVLRIQDRPECGLVEVLLPAAAGEAGQATAWLPEDALRPGYGAPAIIDVDLDAGTVTRSATSDAGVVTSATVTGEPVADGIPAGAVGYVLPQPAGADPATVVVSVHTSEGAPVTIRYADAGVEPGPGELLLRDRAQAERLAAAVAVGDLVRITR